MKESLEQGARRRKQKTLRMDSLLRAADSALSPPFVTIACGGTGGHLFPGLAVAEELVGRGCAVALFISPKEVDQQAVQSAAGSSASDRRDE